MWAQFSTNSELKVAVFSERFSLDSRWFSRASSIEAHVSAQIVRLDESGVKQLRGYGAVSEDLDAVTSRRSSSFFEARHLPRFVRSCIPPQTSNG